MKKKKYVGSRIEIIKNYQSFKERLHHNYRKRKNNNLVNERNFYYFDIEKKNWSDVKKINSDISKSKLEESKLIYLESENKRKKLKNYHSKQTRIFGEGVLYFSEGINEDFKKERKQFFIKINEFKEKFEKEFKTNIIDIVVHCDETGNYHRHYIFENFDNEKSLNITRSKERGSLLQDIAGEVFENYGQGYVRGEKKDIRKKHLTIEEYKEYQKRLKENQDLKNENEKLKKEKEEIEELHKEFFMNITQIYKDLIVLDSTQNREKFLRLFKRYFKNNSKDRLEKLIIKYTTILKKYGKKKDYKSFEEIQKEREIIIQNQSVRSNRDSDLNKYLNEEQETLSPGSS